MCSGCSTPLSEENYESVQNLIWWIILPYFIISWYLYNYVMLVVLTPQTDPVLFLSKRKLGYLNVNLAPLLRVQEVPG
jgi:uncharacterized membrane protein